ncbi:MAG: hypothetical protein H3C63_13090, partial [Candidatus Omnitrophica bacterium]|nr:hypothetical protein [Candidatus Omnitrophota bacterium]
FLWEPGVLLAQDEWEAGFARTADGGYIVAARLPGGWNGARIGLFKLDRDGVRVSSFGPDGDAMVVKDAGLDSVVDVAIDSQGRIVVAGTAPGQGGKKDFAVLRFKPDGSDDASFDGDGGTQAGFDTAGQDSDDRAASLTLEPDDKILVTGTSVINGTGWASVIRFNSDGSRDTSFGNIPNGQGGKLGVRLQYQDTKSALGQRILRLLGGHYYAVAGTTFWNASDSDFGIRVLSASGEPEPFSNTGLEYIPFDRSGGSNADVLYDARKEPNILDHVLLVGAAGGRQAAVRVWLDFGQGLNPGSEPPAYMRVDTSFIGTGDSSYLNRFVGNTDNAVAASVAVDSSDKILLVGSLNTGNASQWAGYLTRLNHDGTPDTSFTGVSSSWSYKARFWNGTFSYTTAFTRGLCDGKQAVLLGRASSWGTEGGDLDVVLTRLEGDNLFKDGFEN